MLCLRSSSTLYITGLREYQQHGGEGEEESEETENRNRTRRNRGERKKTGRQRMGKVCVGELTMRFNHKVCECHVCA